MASKKKEIMSKEQEREELHRAIWQIANDLRGSVDGWDFKSYVLEMLFYRFISENLTNYLNKAEHEAGNANFDYAKLSDEEALFGKDGSVTETGFYILPSQLFNNVRANAKNDEDLNETLGKVFNGIEDSAKGTESEPDFKGLFDDMDVNSNKLGNTVAKRNEKLVKIMDAIGDLNLGEVKDNTIDTFGDAYEYLMGTGFFGSRLPLLARPLMITSEKSLSKIIFFSLGVGSSVTLITSASPFGLAVKYTTLEPSVPCVRSYSLSRVILVTLNRLIKYAPCFPSRYTTLYIVRLSFFLNTATWMIFLPTNILSATLITLYLPSL